MQETVKNWLAEARNEAQKPPANQTFYLMTEGFPENQLTDISNLDTFLSTPCDCTNFHIFSQQHCLRGLRRLDNNQQNQFRLIATRPDSIALPHPWTKETISYSDIQTKTYLLWGKQDDSQSFFYESQIPRKLEYPITLKPGQRAALQSKEYFDAEQQLVFYAFTELT